MKQTKSLFFYLRKEIFMFKEATIQGKISGPVMIVSVTQKQTRTSKPYLILKLRDDQKKEVDAKLWNMSVEEFPFDKNTVIIGEFCWRIQRAERFYTGYVQRSFGI